MLDKLLRLQTLYLLQITQPQHTHAVPFDGVKCSECVLFCWCIIDTQNSYTHTDMCFTHKAALVVWRFVLVGVRTAGSCRSRPLFICDLKTDAHFTVVVTCQSRELNTLPGQKISPLQYFVGQHLALITQHICCGIEYVTAFISVQSCFFFVPWCCVDDGRVGLLYNVFCMHIPKILSGIKVWTRWWPTCKNDVSCSLNHSFTIWA